MVIVVSFLVAASDVFLLELDGGVGDLADARDGELDGGVSVDGLGEEERPHLGLHLGEQRLDHLCDEHRVPDGGVARLHDLLHVGLRVSHLHLSAKTRSVSASQTPAFYMSMSLTTDSLCSGGW